MPAKYLLEDSGEEQEEDPSSGEEEEEDEIPAYQRIPGLELPKRSKQPKHKKKAAYSFAEQDLFPKPSDSAVKDYGIPISHEVFLRGHAKSILALDIDPSGNRIATGGNDEKVFLWDFEGMN